MEPQPVALYARVSTLAAQNPEMQLVELREYAARRGWQVIGEYVDHASAAKESRPALNRLMTDARRREVQRGHCLEDRPLSGARNGIRTSHPYQQTDGYRPPCTTSSQSAEHSCMSCQDTALSHEIRFQTPVAPHMRAPKHDAVTPREHIEVASKHDVVYFWLWQ
jgi:resolvase-like protein